MTISHDRRRFLQTTAAATAALTVPYFVPAQAFGANERVNLGFIGVKNRGMQNMEGFQVLGQDAGKLGCTAAALCDVDSNLLAAAARRTEATGSKPQIYSDYRRLLERKDLDAVVVSTPDHWHALQTIDACRSGKDVYCEKPLTLFVSEGRRMVEVARESGRIVQTGSQQRSDERFRLACERIRNGAIGQVQTVLVGIPGPNHASKPVPDGDPPSELDFDAWLGPAPLRPYNANRVHYNFRFFWDYSGGQMTNFGAHHIDIAQWGLGMDGSGPISSAGEASYPADKSLCEVTKTCRVTHTYASGVTLIVGQGQKDIPGGVTFIGAKGRVFVDRSKITADPPELLAGETSGVGAVRLPVSRNHYQNFLDCVKSRELPITDVEIGHRTATICHLGNVALRLGRKIQWDPVQEQIVGDDAAAALLTRPYREPWKLG